MPRGWTPVINQLPSFKPRGWTLINKKNYQKSIKPNHHAKPLKPPLQQKPKIIRLRKQAANDQVRGLHVEIPSQRQSNDGL